MTKYNVQVGDSVIFVDERRRAHEALVTDIHHGMSAGTDWPGINCVYVASDEDRRDVWGRQLIRQGSVVHESAQPADGMYYY